ncbi:MAG: hypothetical protein O7F12_06840, partial [Nitrospirae bacterium]|nr:hypothetical protein [Nitrospirota bacterium]
NGLIFLARRMRFITEDWLAGAKALEQEIQRRMKRTRQVFTKYFMNRQPERQKKPRSRKSPSRSSVSSVKRAGTPRAKRGQARPI